MQREIAGSAYERQKRLEEGQDRIVGVSCFTGENEFEVMTVRLVAYPYGVKRHDRNERTQVARLKGLKRVRDDKEVVRLLEHLRQATTKEEINLLPHFIECVKA